jgi:hypothetical protein
MMVGGFDDYYWLYHMISHYIPLNHESWDIDPLIYWDIDPLKLIKPILFKCPLNPFFIRFDQHEIPENHKTNPHCWVYYMILVPLSTGFPTKNSPVLPSRRWQFTQEYGGADSLRHQFLAVFQDFRFFNPFK